MASSGSDRRGALHRAGAGPDDAGHVRRDGGRDRDCAAGRGCVRCAAGERPRLRARARHEPVRRVRLRPRPRRRSCDGPEPLLQQHDAESVAQRSHHRCPLDGPRRWAARGDLRCQLHHRQHLRAGGMGVDAVLERLRLDDHHRARLRRRGERNDDSGGSHLPLDRRSRRRRHEDARRLRSWADPARTAATCSARGTARSTQ